MSKSRILTSMLVTAFAIFGVSLAIAQGSLRVGASRVDITPPSDRQNPPSGKYDHERLYVRAIVLDNGSSRAALIGADQGGDLAGCVEADRGGTELPGREHRNVRDPHPQ